MTDDAKIGQSELQPGGDVEQLASQLSSQKATLDRDFGRIERTSDGRVAQMALADDPEKGIRTAIREGFKLVADDPDRAATILRAQLHKNHKVFSEEAGLFIEQRGHIVTEAIASHDVERMQRVLDDNTKLTRVFSQFGRPA